jgi:hypothetical protein
MAYDGFNTDGNWVGFDGCNSGPSGRFAVGPGGELLATAGSSTLAFCGNSHGAFWPHDAGRVGLDGRNLAFYDPDGHLLGRIAPQPTVDVIGTFEAAGGPAPGIVKKLSGDIVVRHHSASGRIVAHARASNGHFEVAVPSGRYVFVGTSRFYNGGRVGCPSRPRTLTAPGQATVAVYCQLK